MLILENFLAPTKATSGRPASLFTSAIPNQDRNSLTSRFVSLSGQNLGKSSRGDSVFKIMVGVRQECGLEPAGASIPPEIMMHFPPCFRFPPISEKIPDSEENSHLFQTN